MDANEHESAPSREFIRVTRDDLLTFFVAADVRRL
jgi:hypothetical protein